MSDFTKEEADARAVAAETALAAAQAQVKELREALDEVLTAIDEVESEPGRGSGTIFRVDWFAKMKLVRDATSDTTALRALLLKAINRATGVRDDFRCHESESIVDAVLAKEGM